MAGVIYICCTSVGRQIIQSHIKNHFDIPIAGIINLNRVKAINKANYDSLFDIAYSNNIEIRYCENINSEDIIVFIRSKNPTLIIQSGWSQKFGTELLSIPKYGCVGEHPSPIPIGRGAACVNWALIENQREWGDSFFKMVEKYDGGQVYAQNKVFIEDYDDVRIVYEKIGLSAYFIIKNNLHHWYKGIFESVQLDERKATYYKKRTQKDGEIDFLWNDIKIYNYVRAITKPYPGAYFIYKGKVVIVWEAELLNQITDEDPGFFLIDNISHSLLVSTGNKKMICFKRLQLQNSSEFYGHEFFKIIELFK